MQSIQSIYIYASEVQSDELPRSATVYITSILLFAFVYYVVGVRKYHEDQVPWSPDLRLDCIKKTQANVALGLKQGCLPPPQLPNQWPLGIDWIRKLWRSDSEQHLLAFLCSIADGYEPRNNLFQYLLFGPRAFHVLDPINLEAVLSTNFQGTRLRSYTSSHVAGIDTYFTQTTASGIAMVSSRLSWAMASSLKRGRHGSTPVNFCANSSFECNTRTWMSFANTLIISSSVCMLLTGRLTCSRSFSNLL